MVDDEDGVFEVVSEPVYREDPVSGLPDREVYREPVAWELVELMLLLHSSASLASTGMILGILMQAGVVAEDVDFATAYEEESQKIIDRIVLAWKGLEK